MPFPVADHYIASAESKLGRSFPVAYRARMTTQNGGVLEIEGEPWFLHPVLDDSDADVNYGAGARFRVVDKVTIRAEYERFEVMDIDVISAAVEFFPGR